MVRLIMHGCNGKMGQVITKIVKDDANAEIVAGVDKYQGIQNQYPVFSDVSECDIEADVVIDFSNAAAVDGLLDYCVNKQVPVVLCTTGLSEEQLVKVRETSEKVAVLKSANMSLGINMLLKLLQDATKILAPAGYDSKRNGSDSLPLIVKVIANLKGVTEEEVIKQTTENTKKVFHKIRM